MSHILLAKWPGKIDNLEWRYPDGDLNSLNFIWRHSHVLFDMSIWLTVLNVCCVQHKSHGSLEYHASYTIQTMDFTEATKTE